KVIRDDNNSIGEDDITFYHSNGFEHRELAIITQQASDVLESATWGIMPNNELGSNKREYYKNSFKWGAGLNARAEKVFDHFIYSNSIYEQRCIIPFDGFFEPHDFEGNKYPCYVHRKDKDSFGLAGLYSITKDGHLTTTILTRPAEDLMVKVHNNKLRQPVILNTSIENNWLNYDLNDDQIKELINTSYNQQELEAYTVSKDIFKRVDTNNNTIINHVIFGDLKF
ncbi:MAG: SOS response-associated peptidase family protein, partial [Flavobacteriaceae bacterium]|nr:SOS response-associated peptidase family protein [Flavobacteriaceae bacterium]